MKADEQITITGDAAILETLLADLDGEFGSNRVTSLETDQILTGISIHSVNLTRLMTRLIEFSRELRSDPVRSIGQPSFSLEILAPGFRVAFQADAR